MGGLSDTSPRKGPGRLQKAAGKVVWMIVVGYLVMVHGGLKVLSAIVTGH